MRVATLQILFNLLGYASQNTTKGSIKISASVTHSLVTVLISDTGAGLSSEKLAALRGRQVRRTLAGGFTAG